MGELRYTFFPLFVLCVILSLNSVTGHTRYRSRREANPIPAVPGIRGEAFITKSSAPECRLFKYGLGNKRVLCERQILHRAPTYESISQLFKQFTSNYNETANINK